MSETIDKRIVEMRFNNKDFEKHANESIKTLDQLKKSMEMDNATTSIDKIAQSVEKLEHRFSAMGIVGKRVIENLTDSAMNLLNKTQAFLSGGIISGGIKRAMNLEKARFTLNGLLDTAEEAEKVVTIAGNSVADTAYSLDQAAVVASQFAASGLTAATAENKLEKALRGVAGVAAITNSDYASLGRIFTQVSGQGRLMGNDLLQLSTRGMNAAATLTDIFNKVNSGEIEAGDAITDMGESTVAAIKEITGGMQITESELRDLVSKSKVSFDIFAESMNAAFGDKAQEADKTVTGAFANIKAALARIGEAFVSPLIKKEGPLVQFLNTAKARINDFKKVLTQWTDDAGNVHNTLAPANAFVYMMTKTLERMTDRLKNLDLQKLLRPMYNVMFGIQNVMRSVLDVAKMAKRAFRDIFPDASLGKLLASISERFYKFSETLKITWERGEKFRRVFRGLWAIVDIGKTALQAFLKVFGPDISKAIGNASGKLLDFSAGIGDVLVGIRNWIKESNVFENVFTKLHALFSFVTSILRTVGNVIQKTFTFITNKVRIFVSAASEGVWNGIKAVFSSITSDVDSMWTHIKTAMGEGWNWLSSHGPFKAAKSAVEAVKEYFADSTVFNFILDAFRKLKSGIQSIIDSFKEIKMDGATSFMEKFKSKFSWLGAIVDFFKAAGRLIWKYGKEAWEVIKAIGKGVGEAFEPIVRAFTDSINHLAENSDLGDVGILAAGSQLALVFYRLSNVFKHVAHLAENAAGVVAGIKGFFFKLGRALKGAKWLMYAEAIKTFAKSILILAGALFILALIPTDSLVKGTAAIVTLIEAMRRVLTSFASIEKSVTASGSKNPVINLLSSLGTTAASMGVQMIMLAGAVAVLTAAIGILGNMEYETLMKGIVMVGIIMKMLSTSVVAMGKNASQGLKAAAVLMAMAIAINMLMLPIILLGAIIQRGFTGALSGGSVATGAAAIISILAIISLIVKMLVESTNEVNLKGAAGMSLILITLSIVMISITSSIALLIAAMSGLSVETEHVSFETGNKHMASVFLAMLGVIGAIMMLVGTLVTLTQKTDTKDILVAAALMLAISISLKLIFSSLVPLVALSLLALPALISMTFIIGTISGLIIAVSEMGKIQNPKGVIAVLLSLSAAIAIISYCIFQMAQLDSGALFQGGLAVAAAVAGLLYVANLVATNGAMATGLYELTGIFVGFGIAAVLFAGAIWIIIDAFEKLDAETDSAAEKIRLKIEAICHAITGSADDIALAVGAVVGAIVLAIADALAETWIAVIKTALKLLEETLDALIERIPTLAPKIAEVVTMLLDELDKHAWKMIDAAISTAITIINAVANTLRNNSTRIVMAIDNVLDAVWEIVLKALLKFFGVAKSKWDDYLKYLKWIAKRVTVIIGGIWAAGKLKGLAVSISGLKAFAGNLGAGIALVKELRGQGVQTFTAIGQVLDVNGNTKLSKMFGWIQKLANSFGGHGLLVTAIAAGAIKASLEFRRYVENMQVVDAQTRAVADSQKEIAEAAADAYSEATSECDNFKESLKDMAVPENKVSSTEEYLDKFKEVFNADGTVKTGMEDMANDLLPEINSELDTRYTIVGNTLTAEGQILDSYSAMENSLDGIIKKLKYKNALEAYSGSYSEAIKEISKLPGEITNAEAKYDEYQKMQSDFTSDVTKMETGFDLNFASLFQNYVNEAFDKGKDETEAIWYARQMFRSRIQDLSDLYSEYGLGSLSEEDVDKTVKNVEELFYGTTDHAFLLNFEDVIDKEKFDATISDMSVELEKNVASSEKTLQGLKDNLSDYSTMKENYDLLSRASTQGNMELADEALLRLQYNISDLGKMSEDELSRQRQNIDSELETVKELYSDNESAITTDMAQNYKDRILLYQKYQETFLSKNSDAYKELKARTDEQIEWLDSVISKSSDASEGVTNATGKISDSLLKKAGLKGVDLSKISKYSDEALDKLGFSKSEISQLRSKSDSVGEYVGEGYGDGILDSSSYVNEANKEIGNSGIKTMKDTLGEASPSKVYYKIGAYVVEGFVNGINSKISTIYPAIGAMASAALDGFNSAIALGSTPTITPIIDLTSASVNDALNAAMGKPNVMSAGLKGMLSTQLAASISVEHLDAEFDRIVESLKTMNDNIVTIGNRVNKLQVVMDTGAVVGQLAAPMDSALGGLAMYKRRGI